VAIDAHGVSDGELFNRLIQMRPKIPNEDV